jgi:hypothetical protein
VTRTLAALAFVVGCGDNIYVAWAPVAGVSGKPTSIAVNPNTYLAPYIIYVSTDGGVFHSADGAMWTKAGPTHITTLASMPMTQVVFAGVDDGSVQLTKDGGATWEATAASPDAIINGWIGIAGVGPLGASVDASGGAVVFRAGAIGASWTAWGPFAPGVATSISYGGGVPPIHTIFVGVNGAGGGVFRSDDVGIDTPTFARTAFPGTDVLAVAAAPSLYSTLFAGTTSGIFASLDGGDTWSPVGLDGREVRAIAVDPIQPAHLFVATDAGVFVTSDAGADWSASLPDPSVHSVVSLNGAPSTVYAITERGLYVSVSGGF